MKTSLIKGKNYIKIIFLLLITYSELSFGSNFNAHFTTNPTSTNETITICKTQTITFTNNSSNTNTSTLYNWQFQGGSFTSSTLPGPHTIVYNTPGTYLASLTLNDGSSYSVTVIVNNATPSIPTISLVDGNLWTLNTYNNQSYFSYCSNDANIAGGLFSFTTQSTQTNANTQHVFDWGDGSSDNYVGTNLGDTFHFYATAGYFTLTYTVILDGGCISQRTYELYIGAIPTATISAVGIPTLCNPGSVTYDLIIGAQNTPGTTYTFQVNDGTPPVTFNHPPPATITHQFLDSSCGTNSNINSTVYPNSYQASITVNNPCGNSTNAVGPINIQSAPVANFTRTPGEDIVCEGTTVAFSDSTEGGYNIGGPPTYTCTQTYRKYWTITGPGGIIATSSGGLLLANPYITCTNNFGFNNNQPNNPGAWLPIASNVLNITFLLPGDYTINFYTGSNLCGISSTTQTICVTPRVIADFTFTNSSNCAPTIITSINNSSTPGCNNTINYTWNIIPSNPDNCPSYNVNGWSFSNGSASNATPEITITSPGIYEVSLTAALNIPTSGALCAANTKTEIITVAGKPITSLTVETICEGNSITLSPTIFNCYATNPVSYFWDFGTNPPTTISSVNDATPTLTFDTAGIYNYSLTISNECGNNTYYSSITVVPKVNLTANGTAATCVNTTIQLAGNISGGTTSGTWSASVAGGTFTPNENDLNPTYTPPLDYIGTITFTLTSDTPIAPCTVVSKSFSTVFNNEATSNAGTYDPLCENTTIQLNGNIGGAAASGTWSDSIGGFFSDINNNNSSYTPPSGYIGNIVLTLTTNDPPGPCDRVSNSTTITVLPTPVVNPSTDIISCDNTTIATINFLGNNANVFNWSNSNTSIGVPASGSGNINFTTTNTTNSAITSTITVTPINNVSTSFCDGNPITFTVIVNPKAQVNPINNQTICNGDLSSLIEFSTSNLDGNTTYEWTNDTPSIGLASNGIGNISSFITTNSTNNPIVATITVTPTYTNNGISCVGESSTFTITVIPTIQINPISSITFCNNVTITPISFTSNITGGVMNYEWTNDNPSIGLNATGIGNISFTPTNNTTTPIIATINVTPIFILNGTSCSGNSESFTITINPSVQVNTTPDQTFCNNSNTNPIVFTTNNILGITVFNWTNNNTSIGLNATGSGDISSFVAVNNTLSPITATITVTPTYTYNGISCIGNPEQINITVNPSAQVNPVSNITICNNNTSTPIQFTTNNRNGSTTYNWTNSNPAIGIPSSGTGDISSFIANNFSNTPITALITVTPTFTNNGTTCSGAAITFTITVNPSAQVNLVSNQSICNGTTSNAVNFDTINTLGTTTFNWTNDTSSVGLPASGTGNISSFIGNNPGLNPITATITVTPIYSYNSVACNGDDITFTIIVNPSPQVIFSENNQNVCSGNNSAEVMLSSTTANVTFEWTAIQPSGIIGVVTSGTNVIPTQNLINSTNTPITINYEAYARINDTNACQGLAYFYSIIVYPTPNIPNTNLLVCSEQNINYAALNGNPDSSVIVPSDINYSWTVSNNPLINGASSGSGSINATLQNLSAVPQIVIYTVTPYTSNCTGNNFEIEFTVLPKPDVLFSQPNQSICNGFNSQIVTLNSTINGNYTYTWNATIPDGINGALTSGTDSIPMQNLTNSTNTPLTIIYEAFAVFENLGSSCTGPVSTYEITVNPTLTTNSNVSNYNGFNISGFGGNNGFINLDILGGSGNYSFTWSGPNGFSSTLEDVNNLTAGDYMVIIDDGICPPITLNFTLNQPDELLISNNALVFQDASCYGTGSGTLGVIISQESVPPYNLEIFSNGTSIQTITNTYSTSPIFSGLFAGIYNIQITDTNGNTKTITNLIISEPTELIVTATATQISCFGSNDASITLSIIGGTPPYTINWNNFATGTQLNNLGAGTYTAIITDAKGCEKTLQTTIANLPVFMLQPLVNQITCYGETDGSIDLGLIGGLAPVTVTWNDGSTAGLVRNNLTEGIYIAIVTDGMGCSIQRTFSIVAPQELTLNAVIQNDIDCLTTNNGGINLIPSGGSPPHSFSWSNGAITEDLTNITNGNYSVIVTDSRGCSAVAQYTIYRPEPLQITLNQFRNVDCSTGEITNNFEAIVSGGIQPYQIIWSNGIVSGANNEFMTTDQNGLITANVIDGNNCSNSANFTISNPEIGNAYFTQNSFSQTTFGYYSIEDPIQFNNLSTGDFIGISWNFGDGVFSTDENPLHTYLTQGHFTVTLTITYELGCVRTYTTILNITKGYKLIMPNGFTANNDLLNDTFGPAFEGLTALKLTIYDSWGNMIYSEEGDNIAGWNGLINNRPAENGNYYYKLRATTLFNKIIEENGPFILLK